MRINLPTCIVRFENQVDGTNSIRLEINNIPSTPIGVSIERALIDVLHTHGWLDKDTMANEQHRPVLH